MKVTYKKTEGKKEPTPYKCSNCGKEQYWNENWLWACFPKGMSDNEKDFCSKECFDKYCIKNKLPLKSIR